MKRWHLLDDSVFTVLQVRQLFSLPASPLQPATKRELLSALLSGLRDVHWCKAVGCMPEPGLMTPLSVESALSGKVPTFQGYQIQRAIAAAERIQLLNPDDRYASLTCSKEFIECSFQASKHRCMVQETNAQAGAAAFLWRTASGGVSSPGRLGSARSGCSQRQGAAHAKGVSCLRSCTVSNEICLTTRTVSNERFLNTTPHEKQSACRCCAI